MDFSDSFEHRIDALFVWPPNLDFAFVLSLRPQSVHATACAASRPRTRFYALVTPQPRIVVFYTRPCVAEAYALMQHNLKN